MNNVVNTVRLGLVGEGVKEGVIEKQGQELE